MYNPVLDMKLTPLKPELVLVLDTSVSSSSTGAPDSYGTSECARARLHVLGVRTRTGVISYEFDVECLWLTPTFRLVNPRCMHANDRAIPGI